jgi:hypothetical protein
VDAAAWEQVEGCPWHALGTRRACGEVDGGGASK